MEFQFVGVNEAFHKLVDYFTINPKYETTLARSSSRVGDVIQINEPVTVKFLNPLQRVLFNAARDCNPFFHVYETLWMLAGRNDVAPLAYYSSGYSKQVDDGNGCANGAYGNRWRYANSGEMVKVDTGIGTTLECVEVDQLRVIIDELKKDPTSRRCVLQMWNVKDDLLKISKGQNYSKDVCCNTAVYFSIRHDTPLSGNAHPPSMVLDMTVTNRSNDLIWGTLGSDVVNLSFLQEYVANCIGVPVGVYNQFTNNLHVYEDRFTPNKWMQDFTYNAYQVDDKSRHVPLVKDQSVFDDEVQSFVANNTDERSIERTWKEPFLQKVAQPMCDAFHCHKQRDYKSAMEKLAKIEADDWKLAASRWIARRSLAWETK